MPNCTYDIIKIFSLSALAFFTALGLTPILTHFLYKYKAWKKGEKRKVPGMGGIIIWFTVLILALFLTKNTWIVILVLGLGALLGLVDDLLKIVRAKGLRFIWRAIGVLIIGLFTGWILVNYLNFEFYYISLVPAVMLIIFSSAPIDGLDGLSAGVLAPMFGAFGAIAFSQGQIDLAIFAGLIAGALLAFLYFNIPPARFFMGETGMLALLCVLPIFAVLTNSLLVLPIIALPLLITSGSSLLQIFSFQIFKKRVFKATPLHHHFEQIGWPHYKITMRYWIFAFVFAILGMVIGLVVN